MKNIWLPFYLLLFLTLNGCFSTSNLSKPFGFSPLHYQPKFEFFELPDNEKMIETTYTSFTTKKPEGGFVFRSFYGKILVLEINYSDKQLTKKNDSFKHFDLNDGKLIFEQNYLNDRLQGKRINYYKSGNIYSVVSFSNNMKNGKGFDYYETGEIKAEYVYKDDIETKPRVYYFKNGVVKASIETKAEKNLFPENSFPDGFPLGYPLYTNVNPNKYTNFMDGQFELFDSLGNKICTGVNDKGRLTISTCDHIGKEQLAEYVISREMSHTSETMPQFPGGDIELLKFFGTNIKYPPLAKVHDVQGIVILGFTIMEDGSVQDLEIIRGIDPSIAEEALRLAKEMPTWSPGKVNGEPVKVAFKLPVRFKLE